MKNNSILEFKRTCYTMVNRTSEFQMEEQECKLQQKGNHTA